MATETPLYLVANPSDGLEFNLARFKENVQNAGNYPSLSDDATELKPGDGPTSQYKLNLFTKGPDWQGERLNRDHRYGRRAPTNYYVLLKHDRDKKFGKNGRFILQLVRHQYLFGRLRDIKTKEVEEQDREARKEQDNLERSERKSGKSKPAKGLAGKLAKRLRANDTAHTFSATGDTESPSTDRTTRARRFTSKLGADDDGLTEFFNYTREAGAMTDSADLVRASDFNKDDQELDFGDEGMDYCGGDNETMEETPDDYLDIDVSCTPTYSY